MLDHELHMLKHIFSPMLFSGVVIAEGVLSGENVLENGNPYFLKYRDAFMYSFLRA